MPLPHFLMLVVAVILAAGVSLVLALAAGVPLPALAVGVALAALVAHVASGGGNAGGRDIGQGPRQTPGA